MALTRRRSRSQPDEGPLKDIKKTKRDRTTSKEEVVNGEDDNDESVVGENHAHKEDNISDNLKKDIKNVSSKGKELPDQDGSSSEGGNKDSEEEEDDSDDNTKNSDNSDNERGGLSEYERLRLERIKRNEARLATLGFEKRPVPKKKVVKRRPRVEPESILPTRTLPGRSSRPSFNSSSNNNGTALHSNKNRVRDRFKKRDICWGCQKEDGETLICCNFCGKLYHPQCHDPPISNGSTNDDNNNNRCIEVQKDNLRAEAESKPDERKEEGDTENSEPNTTSNNKNIGDKKHEDRHNVDGFFRCSDCKHRKRRVACGKCHGCLREESCGSCVFCADSPEFGGTGKLRGPKCIFRQCLGISGFSSSGGNVGRKIVHSQKRSKNSVAMNTKNNGNDNLQDQDDDDGNLDDDEEVDPDVCAVCKDGGDLICCDRCDRAYHSLCHKPKIFSLSDEAFLCMVCKPPNKKRKREGGGGRRDLFARMKKGDGNDKFVKVIVIGPEKKCIVCSKSAEKDDPLANCRSCGEAYHLGCHEPKLDKLPRGAWKCSKCKQLAATTPKTPKRAKEDAKLFEGEHSDICYMCFNGGDLLCCDYCDKAFHLLCHIPPLTEIPAGLWKCCECSALERTRLYRCGECKNCQRPDCGKCTNCKDKPKFGGPNRIKQTCIHKNCPYKRLAPPTTTPITKISEAQKRKIAEAFKNAKKYPTTTTTTTTPSSSVGVAKKNNTNAKPLVPSTTPTKPSKRKTKKESVLVVSPPPAGVTVLNSEKIPKEVSAESNTKEESVMGLDELSSSFSNTTTTELTKIRLPKHLRGDPVSKKIQHLINGALRQADNSKVQDKACELMRKLAKTPEDISKIIELRGIQMIAKAMKEHPDKTIVQAEASALLAELVWVEPLAMDMIASEGCVPLIVQAMDNFRSHAKLQQMGCGAFRAFSYDSNNYRYIHDADGVNAVLRSMHVNKKRVEVLIEGCYFLQNILSLPDLSPDVADAMERQGILSVIVDSMSLYPDNIDFQATACGFLGNVALWPKMKPLVGEYVMPILKRLDTTQYPIEVIQAACSALRVLAIDNDETKRIILDGNGIPTVLAILQEESSLHSSSKKKKKKHSQKKSNNMILVTAIVGLLKELVCMNDVKCSNAIAESGGLDMVIAILRSQLLEESSVVPFVIDVCAILRHVALPVQRKDAALTVARTILSAIKKYPTEDRIQFEGCHALLKLACTFPAVVTILNKSGPQSILNAARLDTGNSSSSDNSSSSSGEESAAD